MSAMLELRKWAAEWPEMREVHARLDQGNGKWTVTVKVAKPVTAQFETGWEESADLAAAKVIASLETIGETFAT